MLSQIMLRPALFRAADLILKKIKAIRQRMKAMMKAVTMMGPLRKKVSRGQHAWTELGTWDMRCLSRHITAL